MSGNIRGNLIRKKKDGKSKESLSGPAGSHMADYTVQIPDLAVCWACVPVCPKFQEETGEGIAA